MPRKCRARFRSSERRGDEVSDEDGACSWSDEELDGGEFAGMGRRAVANRPLC